MLQTVTKNNWPTMLELALEGVLQAVAESPRGSCEESTLLTEADQLRRMRDEVRYKDSTTREPIKSHLLAVSVRDPISVSAELVELCGRVFDVYRRWREQLVWNE